MRFNIILVAAVLAISVLNSCNKLVEPGAPVTQIVGSDSFKDSASLQQDLAGMYLKCITGNSVFESYSSTIPAMSADEMSFLGNTASYGGVMNDAMLVTDPVPAGMWASYFTVLYNANSIIYGVNNYSSSAVSTSFKNQALGEARFMRALCYFYMVNYWGQVPLITGIDVTSNATAPRTDTGKVYAQIVDDLQFAETNLPTTFAQTGNARTRATAWAAKALLARVYLYRKQWPEAEAEATAVINNSSLFTLPTDFTKVFSATSTEAILQFYNDATGYTNYAYTVVPNPAAPVPSFYLTPQLLSAFETGDARKAAWTGNVTYNGTVYTYPYKYKSITLSNTEYYTVLRLAEQYLIRAEARAQQNNLSGAQDDINAIRTRAQLTNTTATSQTDLLAAIAQENRIEFNCEWGHRWFDLKRTGTADAVIGALKPTTWKSTAVLYPVPNGEIQLNNNLTQNQGY
jgi:starch-binding outer membrane protein, SusD/RagB family